uniref:Ig-like domain-containing protein n=1 Tax=Pygocentrus nattereri TaxID=42514 RepID=A0A3B4CJ28_PYGNA
LTIMFFCAFLILSVLTGDSFENVIRSYGSVKPARDGDNVTLSCNYSTSPNDALQWYRQFPRSRPEFLLYIYSHGTLSDPLPPRMSAEVEDKKRVDLIISSAAVSDSALYYCALKHTVTGNPATLYKNCFIWRPMLLSGGGAV